MLFKNYQQVFFILGLYSKCSHQDDCPEGSYLEENRMLGCCPACVRYQEYADTCPGLDWDNGDIIVHGDNAGTIDEWPTSLIE